jgi:hypothetical protein
MKPCWNDMAEENRTLERTTCTFVHHKSHGSSKAFHTQQELLKMSVYFKTASGAETHPAEEQWLKEQLNVKLLMVRVGKRMPTVSRAERQYLVTVKT